MTPEEYLRAGHTEALPQWLADFRPDALINARAVLKELFASRVVFYPGSGSDGHAVKVFGSSHSAHCFVYADYLHGETDIRRSLDSPSGGFLGYRSLARIELQRDQFEAANWTPHITAQECWDLQAQDGYRRSQVYGFLEILERHPHLGDDHGASRLAILFLGADGHATYDALFCQDGQRSPYAVLLQDHGFGGNYSNWGRWGVAARIATETRRLPQFLLIDDRSTEPWAGYAKVDGGKPSLGGVWANRRVLYRRV